MSTALLHEHKLTQTQIIKYFSNRTKQEFFSHTHGKEIGFKCLFHPDKTPSASFNQYTGLWYCHSCGLGGTIYQFEQHLHGYDYAQARAEVNSLLGIDANAPVLQAVYVYRDPNNQVRFMKKRYFYVNENGSPDKFYRYYTLEADGRETARKPEKTFLYRLPEVLAAEVVFVVEGEKCAEAIRGLLYKNNLHDLGAATTNSGGAKKWLNEYSQYLKDKAVIIFPDNDRPGFEHAEMVATSAAGLAKSIKIARVPGPEGYDVADLIEKSSTAKDDLLELIESATAWEPGKLLKEITAKETLGEWEAKQTKKAKTIPDGVWEFTHLEAAEYFAEMYGGSLRYDHQHQRWLIWDGQHWREDRSSEVLQLATKAFRGFNKNEGLSKINAALTLAQVHDSISIKAGTVEFDSQPELLGVQNGLVDLRTGELRPGKQEDWITRWLTLDYDPLAQCPEWEKALTEILDGDKNTVAWFQKVLGYSITGLTKEQLLFILHGEGENGKSMICEIVEAILGNFALKTPDGFFEYKSNPSQFEQLSLKGKRFVYTNELPSNARFNERRIKDISGGGTITSDVKFKNPITFKTECKLFFACNDIPTVRDNSDGFWRRIRNIPFTVSFKGREDKGLKDRLLQHEPQGILRWLVTGAVRYFKEGLADTPEKVMAATTEYKESSNQYAEAIREWFDGQGQQSWENTAQELINQLSEEKYDKYKLYKDPTHFRVELKRAIPMLAEMGIRVEFKPQDGRKRLILIEQLPTRTPDTPTHAGTNSACATQVTVSEGNADFTHAEHAEFEKLATSQSHKEEVVAREDKEETRKKLEISVRGVRRDELEGMGEGILNGEYGKHLGIGDEGQIDFSKLPVRYDQWTLEQLAAHPAFKTKKR